MKLIGAKYPDHAVLAVKCSEMSMKQFARYTNFIDYDDDQLVKYKRDFDALQHLEQLILNLKRELEFNADYQDVGLKVDDLKEMMLIGFSKGGCIVNQLMISLYELKVDLESSTKRKQQNLMMNSSNDLHNDLSDCNNYLSSSMSNSMNVGLTSSLSASFTDNRMFFDILNDAVNNRLNSFYKKLTRLVWLDLGCNAVDDEVYILDDKILQNVIDLNLELHVHSTPRQINCSLRPHIGQQEKVFADKLKDYEHFKRKLYLDRSSSIESHFKLLDDFDPA